MVMLPPQQGRDDSHRALLAQGRKGDFYLNGYQCFCEAANGSFLLDPSVPSAARERKGASVINPRL
jgi:hypothetical protein